MALRKQEHIEQIKERCLIAKKKFSFKESNELREIQNIGARDVNVFMFIVNFLLQVREFLFLICV